MGLVLCEACDRHVRRDERHCPFCGAAISRARASSPERPVPPPRLSRAALLAFAAASLGTACGGRETSTGHGTGDPTSGGTTGAGGSAAAGTSQGGDFGVQFYGAPSFPGGPFGSGGAPGSGGYYNPPPPPYGLPPPPPTDGGPNLDAGSKPNGGASGDAGPDAADAK